MTENYFQGYVYDQQVIDENVQSFAANGVDLNPTTLLGTTKKKIADGVTYENLRDFEVEYLRTTGQQTGRKISQSGIFEKILQATGICVGCAYGDSQWVNWCARFITSGDVPKPRELSLVGPYLLGRANLRGDNGAYPSYSARGFYDYGALTVEDMCKILGYNPGIMDAAGQEAIAIKFRDNFKFNNKFLEAMAPYKGRVYQPNDQWTMADCIANFYSVTVGMGSQITETKPHSNGISGWYQLNGGHETFCDGWFTLNGKLGFLKSESWGKFPSSAWRDNRVTLLTDSGPKLLYPGQGACWADELMAKRPELWANGYPTSNS
jgi:hypothetical protein